MLENKLGLTDSAALADAEERLSKLRARELYDSGRLGTIEVGTFAALAEIHKTLFSDIYDFAGNLRTVNIYKGSTRFVPIEGLASAVKFADIMSQSTLEEICAKFVEMNLAHPFRAGNGRALRIWLDVMVAAAFGKLVDWSKVDRTEYRNAQTDANKLVSVLKSALTDNVSRQMFLAGIDASYALEGYTQYKTEQI